MPARPLTLVERKRRSNALRDQGGLVAPVRLTKDQHDMLVAVWGVDAREADAVRDDERCRSRLYAQACGETIGRVLDGLLKNPSRVNSKGREPC